MEKTINWLHFSDLHYGQKGQNTLLSKLKKELFKDIEIIKNEIGKIDIVFFTGDLTQSGKKEEFDELTVMLNELWAHFNKINSNPLLIAIPGNHDLSRPDITRAVVKVLRTYNNDFDFKNDFWNNLHLKGEYYNLINQCFDNFNRWYNEIKLPKPQLTSGIIPGDISASILINNIKLNIVGLNTAFLELTNDDYEGKLAINPEQLIALTSNDPLKWVEDCDLALLLTHHDPSWFDKESKAFYDSEINPTNTYFNHLCGHLHKANAFEYGLIGSQKRRVQLAPSLFGLQKINNQINRIHGYYAGSYILDDANIIENFYPRTVYKKHNGDYSINADFGFELNNKNFCEIIHTRNIKPEDVAYLAIDSTLVTKPQVNVENEKLITDRNILDLKSTNKEVKELDKIPKISYTSLTQHTGIRLVEQENFLKIIKEEKFIWLITDWGLNEGDFIGSISDQLDLENPKNNFILNCEDIVNEQELIEAFNEQFGMPLQSFCNIVSKIGNNLLVLNHINFSLYYSISSFNRFNEIIQSITDYSPNTYIVLVARQVPAYLRQDNYVKLTPLDAVQVQTYIENHPSAEDDITKPENLLKLIELTSGLPKHIDRIIENLKVTSFEELMELEIESPTETISSELIPKSLIQVIGTLSDTTDKLKLRSFKLLKILTILSNGESINNLMRFDSSEPIYIENANELEQLSLLEIISTNRILSKVDGHPTQQIKILRVPRQIRDYINTIITESEKDDIIKFGCNLYFGNKWREGSIKNIQTSSLYGLNKFLNVDNCRVIVRSLLSNAFKTDNNVEIERAALISINYCDHVYNIGDYKNSLNSSEEIYHLLKSTNLQRLKVVIAKLYGESLRMVGYKDKSIVILNEALAIDGDYLSKDERNEIYVDLGYTYVLQSKYKKAIECAKEIEKTSSSKDTRGMQARYILAQATLKGEYLIKKLKTLESEARRENFEALSNTISLKIVNGITNTNEKIKRLSKILETKNDDYNKIRAIILKNKDVVENDSHSISDEDLFLLNLAYSYLYSQRLESLFTDCHKVLWLYCTNENRYEDLLNLFKHSSLVWRISGEKDLEKEYFDKLEQIAEPGKNIINRNGINGINIDYFERRKLEFRSLKLLN